MSETKRPSSGDNRRSLDHIPEFPSIPRPRVRVKDIQDLGIYFCHQGSILLIQALNHYMRQQWDVFRAVTKGREERSETRSIGKRCRPSNASAGGWLVAANNLTSTDSFVTAPEPAARATFQGRATESAARIEASRQAHPEKGSAMSLLEAARMALQRSGKGALFVAE